MADFIDTAALAANNVMETGIIGSMLVLSLVGNVALLVFLIKCYKSRINHSETPHS